jgi:hypothetical protein
VESGAQTLDRENTYKITGKAKRGALGDVTYDSEKGTYTLTYVTKANDKKAKFQVYTFDNDFNFISMVEDEIEFEKAKTKYTWFKYQGELYTTEGLYVEPNLMGTLILKRKLITYKYDWFLLGYYKTVDVQKKVKPKTDDGKKYHYFGHAEDDVTGDVLILCGVKDNINKNADGYRHFKEFVVLRYNYDVELIGETAFSFNYPMTMAFARSIGNEDGGVGGMSFVFAPMGGPGMNKVADPNLNNFTYVRVDAKPSLVDNIAFESYAPYWQINEMVVDYGNDDIYLFGPSAMGKDKYYNMLTATSKFKAVQLLKISDHKVEYFTETDLEEFESKLKKPADQKKTPSYEGKKFQIANYKVASNGDFFVSGQNFKPSGDGPQFSDIVGFHFDDKGVLKSQYSLDTKESNKYAKANGAEQVFIEGADGKKMFWFKQEIVGVSMARGKMLAYPSGGHVTLADGNISNFTAFGGDEGYYLDPLYPFLETDKGNTIVFFGSDKNGKEIWFARVTLN